MGDAPPAPAPAAQAEAYLDDTWTLWFHDPADADWTNSSYTQVAAISSANNFWAVHSLVGDKIRLGMFFLMREHVFPCWDDPNNLNGGSLSMKVSNDAAHSFWETLCARMLSETLVRGDDAGRCVNGLSVTPKNNFCVFKLWIAQDAPQDPAAYNVPDVVGQILFRSHASCIAEASTRKLRSG